MRRIGCIAVREFLGTVLTRGFIVGVLIFPALLAVSFVIGPRLITQGPPQVRGQIVAVERTRGRRGMPRPIPLVSRGVIEGEFLQHVRERLGLAP